MANLKALLSAIDNLTTPEQALIATAAIGAASAAMPDEADAIYIGPKATGWANIQGKFTNLMDKMQRAEISDAGAIFKGKPTEGKFTLLPQVIKHDELYKQYPELNKLHISYDPSLSTKGEFSNRSWNGEPIIKLGNEADFDTTLHEIQHAIQEKEGWGRGAAPSSYNDNLNIELGNRSNDYEKFATDKMIQDIVSASQAGDIKKVLQLKGQDEEAYNIATRLYKEIGKYPTTEVLHDEALRLSKMADNESSMRRYLRTSGEIEARDTASRMGLSAAQRASTAPYSGQGIPLKDTITKMGVAAPVGAILAEQLAARRRLEEAEALREAWNPLESIATGIPGGIAGIISNMVIDPISEYFNK
jgi:hypothetical protein